MYALLYTDFNPVKERFWKISIIRLFNDLKECQSYDGVLYRTQTTYPGKYFKFPDLSPNNIRVVSQHFVRRSKFHIRYYHVLDLNTPEFVSSDPLF